MKTNTFRSFMIFFSVVFMAIACVKIYKGASVTQSVTAIIFGLLAIVSTIFSED